MEGCSEGRCDTPTHRLRTGLVLLVLFVLGSAASAAQEVRSLDRDRALRILGHVREAIEEEYYDPEFQGVDLGAHFDRSASQLGEATSLGQLYGIIAVAVLSLNDSHTVFLPPPRTARVEYGWRIRAIGDGCYVTTVKPGSDAEAKGLRAGDRVLAVDGRPLTRANLPMFRYRYYILRPADRLRLEVEDPTGARRELEVRSKVKTVKRILDLTEASSMDLSTRIREVLAGGDVHEFESFSTGKGGKRIGYWKLAGFEGERTEFRRMIGKARKHDALILDLRGNGGGNAGLLLDLLSHLFDREVTAWLETRRDTRGRRVTENRGNRGFQGELVVLVDHDSGSSSEVLARVVQLEERAKVLGDGTRGAVVMSRVVSQQLGWDRVIPYAIQVSVGKLTMTDGNVLEGVGVAPDEPVLPTAADLRAGRDPVLVRAAALLGLELDPVQAGKMTAYRWR